MQLQHGLRHLCIGVVFYSLMIQQWILMLCCVRCARSFTEEVLLSRPFYNIAHMVNSIQEVNKYMSRGANSIETDVTFSENGSAKWTYHGAPCDCFRKCQERENLVDYLEYLRRQTGYAGAKYHGRIALLMLDLKVANLSPFSKRNAGGDLIKKLIQHLWYEIPVNKTLPVLLSIPTVADSNVFRGVMESLMTHDHTKYMDKLGFDVGLNSPLEDIRRMYQDLKIESNIWQGDGVSNCLSNFRSDSRLREAITLRDGEKSYMTKVYHWTIDLTTQIRASVAMGVDGVITNYPERVASLLVEKRYTNYYHPATSSDTPWNKISAPLFRPSHSSNAATSTVVSFWLNFSEIASQTFQYLSSLVG